MNHPFSGLTLLTEQQPKEVNGASFGPTNLINAEPVKTPPSVMPIKPPVATTMAIGEEGGFNYNFM